MTPPSKVAEIAGKLSSSNRKTLLGISPKLVVGQQFRLNEGESGAPYRALVEKGLLRSQRFGAMGRFYWLTCDGEAVRAHLQSQSRGQAE